MLENLSVRNYVLIDSLDISFNDGFTVLTGETGSGKSIMLGALSLLLGAKTDKEAVRQGESSAEISGIFSVNAEPVLKWAEDHGIEIEDSTLVIRRLIKTSGRSVYTVNGSPVTVKEGEELGNLLVDVSSQHAHQSLLKPDVLQSLLDEDARLASAVSSYSGQYRIVKELEKEKRETEANIQRSAEEADYMRFSLRELENADLKVGEEEELKAELEVMNSSEFLKECLSSAVSELKTASSSLSEALDSIRKASRKDTRLSEYLDRTESIGIEADDILLSVRSHLSGIDFPESEMEAKNERLMQLQRIRRRFGGSIEEAIRRRDEYKRKLEEAEQGDAILEKLSERLEKERVALLDMAEHLLSERKKTALKLERRIEENLKKLGMNSAVFQIRVGRLQEPGPHGIDSVSFLIAPNKGEKLSLVQDTASGGELSRIMLAIKASLASSSSVTTMLFDEIDAGIGGAVANAVGEEMKALARNEQVIAITHLPQIASRASSHYLVEKEERNGRTVTRIRKVRGEDRVREIARLLSGETSDLSLEHARSLLEVQDQ